MFGHSSSGADFVRCARERPRASADRDRLPGRRRGAAVVVAAPRHAAAVVLPGQRGVPLPRPGVCGAAVHPPGRARGGVAADRGRGHGVRGLAPPLAAAGPHRPARARAARPARGRAGHHEHGVLPRGGATAARDRGCHRVCRGRAAGNRRCQDTAQCRGACAHRLRRGRAHRFAPRRAAAGVRLRLRQLRAVRALRDRWAPDRQYRRGNWHDERHRPARRGDAGGRRGGDAGGARRRPGGVHAPGAAARRRGRGGCAPR